MTSQAEERWRQARRRLSLWWWAYLIGAVAAGLVLAMNFQHGDSMADAIFFLIAILGLRGAWRMERAIIACDQRQN